MIYTCGLLLCFISNAFVLINLFKKEFEIGKENEFNQFSIWFKKYASISGIFRFIYILSTLNIELMEILYCRAFNYKLFYAPFCFNSIKYLKKSSIFTTMCYSNSSNVVYW